MEAARKTANSIPVTSPANHIHLPRPLQSFLEGLTEPSLRSLSYPERQSLVRSVAAYHGGGPRLDNEAEEDYAQRMARASLQASTHIRHIIMKDGNIGRAFARGLYGNTSEFEKREELRSLFSV